MAVVCYLATEPRAHQSASRCKVFSEFSLSFLIVFLWFKTTRKRKKTTRKRGENEGETEGKPEKTRENHGENERKRKPRPTLYLEMRALLAAVV